MATAIQQRPTGEPPMILVRDLAARYGDRTILDHVSFEVRRGEVLGIVGGSGCGKTTLMKCMIGLLRPSAGEVIIDGEDLLAANEDQLRTIQRRIGVAFQAGALFASLTVGENIALLLEEYTSLSGDMVDLIVRMKLSMVRLGGSQHLQTSELSGGMRKRAGLARAMALDPAILFFDEPSAGLDPITSAELDQLIVQINKSLSTTIVVVTHELPSIFTIADRVIMLDGETKTIIAEGDPKMLREQTADKKVHAFFNRLAE